MGLSKCCKVIYRIFLFADLGISGFGSVRASLNCSSHAIVFPIVHGAQGEDGVLQGFLNILNVPFVGSDVLGASLCMAKHVAKDVLRSHQIPVVPGLTAYSWNRGSLSYSDCVGICGDVLFIKPCASGSSIGVSRVTNSAEFDAAMDAAFRFDDVVLVEKAIEGREIECSILGNNHPEVSCPGEIVLSSEVEFYDYHTKYSDESTAFVQTPASLTDEQAHQIKWLAKAYQRLCCCGLARVDFFLTPQG